MRPISLQQALASWALYLPWGVVQQYALNGYFLTRLEHASSRRLAPWLAALLFSATTCESAVFER